MKIKQKDTCSEIKSDFYNTYAEIITHLTFIDEKLPNTCLLGKNRFTQRTNKSAVALFFFPNYTLIKKNYIEK